MIYTDDLSKRLPKRMFCGIRSTKSEANPAYVIRSHWASGMFSDFKQYHGDLFAFPFQYLMLNQP
jgi:hypothetical protein